MSAHRGPTVPLVNTGEEKSAAAQTNQVEHGTETKPIIQTDSLATSSIIYSALSATGAGANPPNTIGSMKKVAERLSQNSLTPWYKGAVLLVGTPAEIESVYGAEFRKRQCHAAAGVAPEAWAANGADMLPWLTEIRRTYGNGWEGCMQVAAFVEQYQAAKIRDQQWAAIPAVSTLDRENGSVRGWAGIHQPGNAHLIG